ncbi:MFS transporter [Nonomuraea soli]|uniref:Putative proline/betaine transporter n=1 Tax=Nonomuraea soli TaxID=1032476 RepID=A0A7W0HU75_9ACTN|nr:MFS transporter [Nonomuraea soli]MBA2895672.1 metabolite-proton symporter [Nonomuraea soli]
MSIKKVVGASLIGTTIEWYDFFLYGSAAALIFPTLFFPKSDPTVATMLAFLTFALGFVARPLGGIIFGHFGDRIGRKTLLVISLLMMGGATFAIGLLPTYASVGILAPILLVALRLIQGVAIGGEWGGAVLIVSEHGDAERRGFWASWPQAGVACGNLLATAVLAVLAAVQSDEAFNSWGWRVPFLLSAILVLVGMWIRLAIEEPAVFKEAVADAPAKMPLVDVFRYHWRDVLTALGARFVENVSYYVITAFVLVYAVQNAGLTKPLVLNCLIIASTAHLIVIPLWGALSDRIGRKPVYLLGAVGVGLWSFAFFPLIDSKNFAAVTLAVTVGLILHGAMYGPQAAYFSELFGTKVRYSGVSVGYQLASIVAGGLAPTIALALLEGFGSPLAVSLYVAAGALLTAVTVAVSRETRGRDLRSLDEKVKV